jgi:hypothetical protein
MTQLNIEKIMIEYWKEAVAESLECAGVKATENQINEIAKDIKISVDCSGMYSGEELIPDPREIEADKLKVEIKQQAEKHERFLFAIKKRYAMGKNFNVEDVYIDSEGKISVS